jgi:hypothetical protein
MKSQNHFFRKCIIPLLYGNNNIDDYKILETNQGFFLTILAKDYLLIINASDENVPLMKMIFDKL